MRIGILTYHKSLNNGSALQAYALKKKLQNMNYNVEIIDYTPEKYKEIYGLLATYGHSSFLKKIALFGRRLFLIDMFLSNKRKYTSFQQKYLSLSKKKYFFNSDFEALNNEYDVLITGSDQIWNTVCADCDLIYFLPISHIARKVAYAPSCNDTKQFEEKYIHLLQDYDNISVREESGKKTIDTILPHMDIRVASDPTFLLEPKDYEHFGNNRLIRQDYIFLYSVKYSDDVIESAKLLSKKLRIPVYTMVLFPQMRIIRKLKKSGIKYKRHNNGPVDFLNYIKNSKFVVSDSFHGTAFSLIFNKQFYSVNIRSNNILTNDERICTILEKMNLKNRYLTFDMICNLKEMPVINYKEVSPKKRAYANESIEWLKNAVEGKKE